MLGINNIYKRLMIKRYPKRLGLNDQYQHPVGKSRYGAYSLMELIIVIAILGILVTVSSRVLVTLIQVSTLTKVKVAMRQESKFIETSLSRNLKSADAESLRFYKVSGRRISGGKIADAGSALTYQNVNPDDAAELANVNEIQFALAGNPDRTICYARFEGTPKGSLDTQGFIVRSVIDSQLATNHPEYCFSDDNDLFRQSFQILHMSSVDVTQFDINYIQTRPGLGYMTVDFTLRPVYWVGGEDSLLSRDVVRQVVVHMDGLTW